MASKKVRVIRSVINPRVSVIIPTLNEEKYIERCLFSLRDQDFDCPYEIIIVDSASEDDTIKIAEKYADKIIVIKEKGAGLARNVGAREAKSEILIFLDADTFVLKNFLKAITKPFEDKDVIAATCPCLVDSYQQIFPFFVANFLNKQLAKVKKCFFPAIITAIRKNVFIKVGGYPNIWPSEDVEFSLKLQKLNGKFAYVTDTYVIASSRRSKKYGAFGTLKCFRKWFLSYFIDRKLFGKTVKYENIR